MTDVIAGLPPGLPAALLLGLAAGLAVAVPLGPVGLLILDRSAQRGRSYGYAAAGGVATVDLAYAALAVTGSAWAAAAIEPWRRPAGLIAAGVLAALGLMALIGPRRRGAEEAVSLAEPADQRRLARTYLSFVGLTALNPATVTYFAALAVGLSEHLASWSARSVFVLAAGVASLAWQSLLVILGGVLAARAARLRQLTRRIGGGLLLVYALLLVL